LLEILKGRRGSLTDLKGKAELFQVEAIWAQANAGQTNLVKRVRAIIAKWFSGGMLVGRV
jgi:hypothetical protein